MAAGAESILPGRYPYAAQQNLTVPIAKSRCRVESLASILPDGRIACLGVGPIQCYPDDLSRGIPRMPQNLQTAEVTCLAFQKVDRGVVNALLPTAQFVPVNWEDRPTNVPALRPAGTQPQHRFQYLHNEIELGQGGQQHPVHWHHFTKVMAAAKVAILDHMKTPIPDPENPQNIQYQTYSTLHEGHKYGTWDTPQTSSIAKAALIRQEVRRQIPIIHPAAEKWIEALCDDLISGNANSATQSLLIHLFPDIIADSVARQQRVRISPSNTSTNISVARGVPHCLVYGYHKSQKDLPRGSRGRPRVRTPLQHRVVLRKKYDEDSRSRSRSPVSNGNPQVNDEALEFDVQHVDGVTLSQNDDDVIDHPGDYIISRSFHHNYFESRRPDVMVVETTTAHDLDTPNTLREEARVKLVVDLSTSKKPGTGNLKSYVEHNTEQCVQDCLASLGYNQDLILGLVALVDGFKLIKIQKQPNQGNPSYDISETDFIVWDNQDAMLDLFQIINNTV